MVLNLHLLHYLRSFWFIGCRTLTKNDFYAIVILLMVEVLGDGRTVPPRLYEGKKGHATALTRACGPFFYKKRPKKKEAAQINIPRGTVNTAGDSFFMKEK
ncbi:MAG: hypothetical protein GF349_02965 [Candidatus Magasanikbacteria bacterium]|nr:hypothetical protein [Candidatus Magasanikbacteria bacterium]